MKKIIIIYLILAFINFLILRKLDLEIIDKNKNVVKSLSEIDPVSVTIFYIILSIFWVITLPKLYFNSIDEKNKN